MILGLNIIFTGIYILSVLVTDILLGILDRGFAWQRKSKEGARWKKN